MDTKPKLHYFNCYGRGEPIRLAFSFFKIDYEEVEVPMVGTPGFLKEKYEYGKVPIVEMDGMTMPETRSIVRYICLKNGHHPIDPVNNYRVNQLLDHFYDVEVAFYQACFFAKEEDKAELTKKFFQTTMLQTLTSIEKQLKQNVSQDYLVADKLTAADIVFVDFAYSQMLNPKHEERVAYYKQLLKSFPVFSAYIEKRKEDFPRLKTRPEHPI